MAKEPNDEINQNFNNNLQIFLRYVSLNVSFFMKRAEKLYKRINLNRYLDKISQRPWLAAALIVTTSLTVIFVSTFVFLILITSTIALTGIVLIEGTIITIGTVILIGCIASIWIIVGVIAVTGALFYYGTLYFHTHFYSLEANVTDLINVDNIQRNLYEKNEQSTEKIITDNIKNVDVNRIQDTYVNSTDNISNILEETHEWVSVADKKKRIKH